MHKFGIYSISEGWARVCVSWHACATKSAISNLCELTITSMISISWVNQILNLRGWQLLGRTQAQSHDCSTRSQGQRACLPWPLLTRSHSCNPSCRSGEQAEPLRVVKLQQELGEPQFLKLSVCVRSTGSKTEAVPKVWTSSSPRIFPSRSMFLQLPYEDWEPCQVPNETNQAKLGNNEIKYVEFEVCVFSE